MLYNHAFTIHCLFQKGTRNIQKINNLITEIIYIYWIMLIRMILLIRTIFIRLQNLIKAI